MILFGMPVSTMSSSKTKAKWSRQHCCLTNIESCHRKSQIWSLSTRQSRVTYGQKTQQFVLVRRVTDVCHETRCALTQFVSEIEVAEHGSELVGRGAQRRRVEGPALHHLVQLCGSFRVKH